MQANTERTSKRAVNLTVNAELLNQARASGINLSATLESALREQIRQAQRRQWLEENREAIANYNRMVERDGVFSDGLRSF
ncbi:MAG TPA: type II toxin-antitoxin system CcdA family antitoxin [Gammaproteobacteria bacterium]|nr:type II toxin-antitoxin system CcdA family antitoxin [Gammaproteobacteria bacterium]